MKKEVQPNTQQVQPLPQTSVSIPNPISTNCTKFLLFILLGLGVVAGSMFIGILIGKKQTSNQQSTVSSSQMDINSTTLPTIPNPSIIPNPEWNTYSNEKYGIKVKYHPTSVPIELEGNNEVGQFTYLFLVKFGTNPIKSPFGYVLRITKMTPDYRGEIVGHIADKIDSEEVTIVNNNTWKKYNYQIFLTTDNIRMTDATINHGGYSYAITSSSIDIDHILSTFEFTK